MQGGTGAEVQHVVDRDGQLVDADETRLRRVDDRVRAGDLHGAVPGRLRDLQVDQSIAASGSLTTSATLMVTGCPTVVVRLTAATFGAEPTRRKDRHR